MHFKKIFKLFGKVVKNEVVPPFPILVMFFLIKSLPFGALIELYLFNWPIWR